MDEVGGTYGSPDDAVDFVFLAADDDSPLGDLFDTLGDRGVDCRFKKCERESSEERRPARRARTEMDVREIECLEIRVAVSGPGRRINFGVSMDGSE
jgi:hypothetical protein